KPSCYHLGDTRLRGDPVRRGDPYAVDRVGWAEQGSAIGSKRKQSVERSFLIQSGFTHRRIDPLDFFPGETEHFVGKFVDGRLPAGFVSGRWGRDLMLFHFERAVFIRADRQGLALLSKIQSRTLMPNHREIARFIVDRILKFS